MSCKRPLFFCLFLLGLLFAGFLVRYGSDRVGTPQRRCTIKNVVLVSLDTLRADALGAYGNAGEFTPNLDALAASGFLFERAYTHAPMTAPAHMSLLTSTLPYEHKVCNTATEGCTFPLGNHLVTLAELLQARGFETTAFTGGGSVDGRYGFARGFRAYHDSSADFVAFPGPVLHWLRRAPIQRPFFLFLHTYKTHSPYFPEPRIRERFCSDHQGQVVVSPHVLHDTLLRLLEEAPDEQAAKEVFWLLADRVEGLPTREHRALRALVARGHSPERALEAAALLREAGMEGRLPRYGDRLYWSALSHPSQTLTSVRAYRCLYQAEARELDAVVGLLLDTLAETRRINNTLLVVLSDHGEEFLDHGGMGHGMTLYEEALRVPLIVKHPCAAEPLRIPQEVGLIDVAPTILELLGLPLPKGFRGRSLVPLLHGEALEERAVYAELAPVGPEVTSRPRQGCALVLGRRKLVQLDGKKVLFDLASDPTELHNHALQRPELTQPLALLLEPHLLPREPPAEVPRLPDTLSDQLRQLGYAQ